MPRTTRKQRVEKLLETLQNGPHYLSLPMNQAEIAKGHFKLWCEQYVLPEIHDLVPELYKKRKKKS